MHRQENMVAEREELEFAEIAGLAGLEFAGSAGSDLRQGFAEAARFSITIMATRTTGGTYQIWALKEIRMHGSFSGAQDEFESCFFTLEAEVTEMGWRRLFGAAVTHDGPIKLE